MDVNAEDCGATLIMDIYGGIIILAAAAQPIFAADDAAFRASRRRRPEYRPPHHANTIKVISLSRTPKMTGPTRVNIMDARKRVLLLRPQA